MPGIDDSAFEHEDRKHQTATEQAEAALRAEASGNQTEADILMDAATRTDPDAVAAVLQRAPSGTPPAETASDQDVAAMTRTMEPHAAAPSRAGITEENGSGADGEQR